MNKWYVNDVEEPPFDPLTSIQELTEEETIAAWMQCPLKPAIHQTVCLLSPGLWGIGSLMLCKTCKEGESIPPDTVCSWADNGTIYYVQKRATPREDREPEGDYKANELPFYNLYQRALWNISDNVFVKVKPWVEGLTTEATTIRWVNKNCPSIPTEEIIYDWVDTEWNRTIMISKRVPGRTYEEAWAGLTTNQRLRVAEQVAKYLVTLAENTSDNIETVEGNAIQGEYSLRVREILPVWMPRLEPKVTREEFIAFEARCDDGVEPLGAQEPFVLQHPDVNPANFLVSEISTSDEIPRVTGIIDWERVGYGLKWHVATFARINDDYVVDVGSLGKQNYDWQWMLSNACVRAGFPLNLGYIHRSTRRKWPHYPNAPIEHLFNSAYMPS